MPHATRRIFIARTLAGGCVAALGTAAHAATHVDEADETAVALGYRQDSRQVDGAKYPTHAPQQRCVECAFWQGVPADDWAGCAMFGRKQVAAGAWCRAWAKK
jgi:hypothetical protein